MLVDRMNIAIRYVPYSGVFGVFGAFLVGFFPFLGVARRLIVENSVRWKVNKDE